jgi:23S rRNA (uracil1939-C5)-methyltransferase
VVESGSTLTLAIEKPAAGGRMLARHRGQVVLVWGAIPGERVTARVERVGKGVIYADTTEVLTPSPDRRPVAGDWRCGGSVLAFVEYPRQLELKGQIIQDALARIGRVPLSRAPAVIGSPEHGYRMRARLHVADGKVGFYREGTHSLCEAAQTKQLAESTNAWLATIAQEMPRSALTALAAIELSESIDGEQRACHLELHAGAEFSTFRPLTRGLVGLSAARADRRGVEVLGGAAVISDVVGGVRFQRDARAFFQGNRFLVGRLLEYVLSLLPPGPVLDLYAGVGLFGLSAASAGAPAVIVVEGDPISGADLAVNAEPFADRVRVERRSVEQFLAFGRERKEDLTPATMIVDPPRTGMTKEALAGAVSLRPVRIVYVSCDVATLARDTRTLLDAGYELQELTGIDLFPNTAHVESVALFSR